MKRGEVYWADLVPRSGSEQRGRRPVIVISHDAFNQTQGWRSIIVVPLSTSAAQAGGNLSPLLLPPPPPGPPKKRPRWGFNGTFKNPLSSPKELAS